MPRTLKRSEPRTLKKTKNILMQLLSFSKRDRLGANIEIMLSVREVKKQDQTETGNQKLTASLKI